VKLEKTFSPMVTTVGPHVFPLLRFSRTIGAATEQQQRRNRSELCPGCSAKVDRRSGGGAFCATRGVVHKGDRASRGHTHGLLLVFAQSINLEVAVRFQPVHLDRERLDQGQAARGVREMRTTSVRRDTVARG